jgi:hypothetical protein
MNHVNQMQGKILSAMRSIVEAWELEWVEILGGPCQGTIRLMPAGGFRTLLKIEYEFQPERYQLLVYRDGKHIFGRCNISYDDGAMIEQILERFGRFTAESLVGLPEAPAASRQSSDAGFRRTLSRSMEEHV